MNEIKLSADSTRSTKTTILGFRLQQTALVALVLFTNLQLGRQFHSVEAAISRANGAQANKSSGEGVETLRISQARQEPFDPPRCRLGPWEYSIGDRWPPYLPGQGLQRCMRCECTLKYQLQGDCFEPTVTCQRLDKFPHCLDHKASCPPGQERRAEPGACCPTCLPVATSSTTTSRPRAASLWLQSRPPPLNAAKIEPNYDEASGHETFWLFKVISRSADERELISAVKEISFCPSMPVQEHWRPAQKSSPAQSASRSPQRSHTKQPQQRQSKGRGRKEP